MTPLVRWLKKAKEKFLGHWSEGPEPPERFEKMVITFAEMYPHATRKDWIAFATAHAGEAYRSGFIRGLEWVERNEEMWMPDIEPEVLADAMDPNWKWQPMLELQRDPFEVVPEEFADEDILRHQLDEMIMMRGKP